MVIIKVSYLAALKQELEDFVGAVVLSTCPCWWLAACCD